MGPAHNTASEARGEKTGEAGSKLGSLRWSPDFGKESGSYFKNYRLALAR